MKSIEEQYFEMMSLIGNLSAVPMLEQYFDVESEENLDRKIEMLEALAIGKPIESIENYEELFELLPKDQFWD